MRVLTPILGSLLMAVVAMPAHAALDILRETRDAILYIDRAGIEKQGNIQRVMSTQDFHRTRWIVRRRKFVRSVWKFFRKTWRWVVWYTARPKRKPGPMPTRTAAPAWS